VRAGDLIDHPIVAEGLAASLVEPWARSGTPRFVHTSASRLAQCANGRDLLEKCSTRMSKNSIAASIGRLFLI
jgi:hypothetical protein